MKFKIIISILWLAVAITGIAFIAHYESRPGNSGETPLQWPANASIALSPHNTFVMFAHPQCPCTRASIEEMNQLLARSRDKVSAHVVFFHPATFSTNWMQTELWRSTSAIPGVAVHEDLDGSLAKKFGAETSGYTVLYDSNGKLLFHGGITWGRGHIGANVGQSSVAALLSGNSSAVKNTPVYGCSLTGQMCSTNCSEIVTVK